MAKNLKIQGSEWLQAYARQRLALKQNSDTTQNVPYLLMTGCSVAATDGTGARTTRNMTLGAIPADELAIKIVADISFRA